MSKKDTPTIVDLSGFLPDQIQGGAVSAASSATVSDNADMVDGFHAYAAPVPYALLALDGDAKLPTDITGDANTVDGYHAADLAVLAAARTITGLWTFSRGAGAPFAVASGAAKVAYLDADKLDGYDSLDFPRKAENAAITGSWTFHADPQINADLDFLGARSITSNGANNLTLAPAGDLVLDPAGNDVIPALSMDVNLGTATKRFLALHAAELWVQNLVAQDVIATIGGRVTAGPTTMLTEDVAATPPNMLYNGSFEIAGSGSVFAGWPEYFTDGQVIDDTVKFYDGAHSCKLVYGSDSNDRLVSTAMTVIPGHAYFIAGMTSGDGSHAGSYRVWDVSHGASIIGKTSTGYTGAGWAWVTDWFVAPAGCTQVMLILYPPVAAGAYCHFDYFTIFDSTIVVKHNEASPDSTGGGGKAGQTGDGDTLYMEKAGQVEYMYVLSGPTGSGPYAYGVIRNRDGTGRNDWLAGDTIVNTGKAGDGIIDLYAQHGILGSGSGPTIVGWVRGSRIFNDMTERWAIGNLNSLYGVGANDTYGVGLGQYASGKGNVLIDDASGIKMRTYNTTKFQVQPDGDVFIGSDVSAPASTFLSVFTNAQNYNGESVEAGDALFGDNSTTPAKKANMFWDKSAGRLNFRGGTTPQLYIDTDGTLIGAGGAVKLNSNGLVITAPSGSDLGTNSLLFKDGSGNVIGSLAAHYITGVLSDSIVTLSAPSKASTSGTVIVSGESPTGVYAYSYLRAKSGTTQADLTVSAHSTYGTFVNVSAVFTAEEQAYMMKGLSLSTGGPAGGTPTTGCIHIPNGHLIGNVINSLADDTAVSYTPQNKFSAMLVSARASNYLSCSALVVFRAYTTPFCQLLVGGANTAVTTGALSGTTGVDGKFTISAHTDGKVYFENRLGVTVSFHYVCIGA